MTNFMMITHVIYYITKIKASQHLPWGNRAQYDELSLIDGRSDEIAQYAEDFYDEHSFVFTQMTSLKGFQKFLNKCKTNNGTLRKELAIFLNDGIKSNIRKIINILYEEEQKLMRPRHHGMPDFITIVDAIIFLLRYSEISGVFGVFKGQTKTEKLFVTDTVTKYLGIQNFFMNYQSAIAHRISLEDMDMYFQDVEKRIRERTNWDHFKPPKYLICEIRPELVMCEQSKLCTPNIIYFKKFYKLVSIGTKNGNKFICRSVVGGRWCMIDDENEWKECDVIPGVEEKIISLIYEKE